MKGFVIVIAAVIAGYVLYKWSETKANKLPAMNTTADEVFGIPTFDTTPAVNKPDQLAAFAIGDQSVTDEFSGYGSRLSGTDYFPAFGPNENQPGASGEW